MTINLDTHHIKTLLIALEAFQRARMGQFRYMLEAIFPNKCLKLDNSELFYIQDFLKRFFFPGMTGDGGPGICNKEVGQDAQVAYELQCLIEQFCALKESDGWFSSHKKFDGFYLNPSGLPPAKIEGLEEMQYKDFFIPEDHQYDAQKAYFKDDHKAIWQIIKDRMSDLPKGEKYEIKASYERCNDSFVPNIYIRVYKPRKP